MTQHSIRIALPLLVAFVISSATPMSSVLELSSSNDASWSTTPCFSKPPFLTLRTKTPACVDRIPRVRSQRSVPSVSILFMRKEQGDVEHLLKVATAAVDGTSPVQKIPNKIAKAIQKAATKSAMLVPEFRRDETLIPHDVAALSRLFRERGAGAILVDCSVEDGVKDLRAFISEQASAKGQFPGPCPVIQRGLASTLAQVAGAASSGVQGVCVSGAAGPNQDSLAQLVTGAHALGLEVLVEVQDSEGVQAAIEASAQILCVRDVQDVEAAAALYASVPQGVATLAAVPAMQPECREVEQTLFLVSAGYSGVILADCARDAEADAGYAEWALQTMKSKRSESFSFNTIGTSGEKEKQTFEGKWDSRAAKRDPTAWAKWKKYKKSRDYQIRATVWGA